MKIELKYQPAATVALVLMESGESFSAESGALMALRGPVLINTSTYQRKRGGILSGLKRLISGESFFINHFTASGTSEVWLSAPLPGDMMVHQMVGQKLIVSGGSYLAAESDVHIDMEWQGLKSIFSGENLFWIKATGNGQLLLNSFGFIYSVDVDGEYVVDTGHIVAFEETLNFSISKSSAGWIESYLSGEGFVCRFKGKGKVWCQSHNPNNYGHALTPYLRPRRN